MATDLKSISNLTADITSLGNLVLVNPQNDIGYYQQANPFVPGGFQQTQNVPGFLFDYEGENAISLEADITDHYIENNTTVSDQIATKPILVSVQGFVGEVNDIFPKYDSVLKEIQSKLQTLSAFEPELSESALIALNNVALGIQVVTQTANNLQQTYNAVTGSKDSAMNKQQKAFNTFYQAFVKKNLFTIQTPWAVFNNMAIKSLRAIQSPETRMITDFEIQFKKIYTIAQTFIAPEDQGRLIAQNANITDLGTNSPSESPISFSSVYESIAG